VGIKDPTDPPAQVVLEQSERPCGDPVDVVGVKLRIIQRRVVAGDVAVKLVDEFAAVVGDFSG
jgi:hypothetical protein